MPCADVAHPSCAPRNRKKARVSEWDAPEATPAVGRWDATPGRPDGFGATPGRPSAGCATSCLTRQCQKFYIYS